MKNFESADDFGDLYTDVEAQASSAINSVPGFTPLRNDSVINVIKWNETLLSDEEDEVDSHESDSEDDLNIVLNDEDCKTKSTAVVSDEDCKDKDEDENGFVAINESKTCGSSSPSDTKVNLSTSMLAIGGWRNQNVRGRCKGPISSQGPLAGATQNLGMSQRRCFTLPWHRSILDISIDAFEEKPWRYSGVDITDYFNFGLNEESWKQYCNSVDQFRLSASVPLRNRSNVYGNQAYEAGSKYGEGLDETMVDDVYQPNGRAIQVEDGDGERQPTVAIRPPRDRDTDVVIEINLKDHVEKFSDSGGKQNLSPSKTSSTGVFDVNDNRYSHCSGGMGDEFSVGFMEGKDRRLYRCSAAKTTSSNPMTDDSRNPIKNQSQNDGDEDHSKKKSFSSDEIELVEAANKSRESNVLNVSCASVVEAALSLEEEDQLSLISSCFESDSEASRDGNYLDRGNSISPVKRSSPDSSHELWGHDSSRQKNSKGNYAKVKPVDARDFSKRRIPARDERKHWSRGVDISGSDAEDINERKHSPANFGRWKENLQDVVYKGGKDLAIYKESEHFYASGGRELGRNRWYTTLRSCRKVSRGFHKERYSYHREDWKERRHLCEDERNEGRWHRQGPLTRDMKPVANIEAGRFISRHSYAREEMDSRLNRSNSKLQFRKSNNHGTWYRDRELEDADFIRERHEISINRKRGHSYRSYESQFLRRGKIFKDGYRGNADFSSLSHQLNRDPDGLEDEYCENMDARYLYQHSYGEREGRWTDPMSPTNGVPNLRFIERGLRHVSSGEGGDSYNDSSNFPDRARFKRKRDRARRPEVLPWTKEDVIVSMENSSFFSKNSQRHTRDYRTRESLHDRSHIDEIQSDQLGYDVRRDESNSRSIYRSNRDCGVKNEQAFMRCRDSVGLSIGEEKLSGRRHKDRDSRFNRRVVEDQDVESRVTTTGGLAESPKVGHNIIVNEKVHHRSPVVVQNEDFDIEEGQIVTEDSSEYENRRIMESLAKMEKRRERFKEPIKKEQDKFLKADIGGHVVAADAQAKQHRPVRKRQWC